MNHRVFFAARDFVRGQEIGFLRRRMRMPLRMNATLFDPDHSPQATTLELINPPTEGQCALRGEP